MVLRFPIIFTLFCCLTCCYYSSAQAPKFSNEYLSIGIGGRGHAMAGAIVASTNDVTSGYWNPAGLASINSSLQMAAMHAEWFAGIGKYDYLSIAKPLNNKNNRKAIGLSLVRFGIDNIPNTINLIEPDGTINYNNIKPFSASDYAGLVTYAQQLLSNRIQLGGSIKILHRRAGKFATAWGFGLDLGAIYKLDRNFQLGFTARDITSTFNAWKFNFTSEEQNILFANENEVPTSSIEITTPKFILGAAYQNTFQEKLRVLIEMDFDFTTDGQRNVLISSKSFNIDPKMGIELGYKEFIFLRAGIGNFQYLKNEVNSDQRDFVFQPNAGIGIKLRGFIIDYAYTDVGNVSQVLYSHIVSVVVDLKLNKKEKVKSKNNTESPRPPKVIIEQID